MTEQTYTDLKKFFTRLGLLPVNLWVILLVVNLMVLALPLGGIFFFRIYENQLIRETESELIVQSALIAEIYKREIRANSKNAAHYGRALDMPRERRSRRRSAPLVPKPAYYTPIKPQLDLATGPILASRPDGELPARPADDAALAAGIALTEILLEAQRTTLAGMRILDFNGITIAGRNELGLSFAHVFEIRRALHTGRYVSTIRQRISDEPPPPITSISRGTNIRIFTVMPIIAEGRLWGFVYLSRTPSNILKHMSAEKGKVIAISTLLLALILLVTFLTSWTIARPISQLIRRMKRIEAGDRQALSTLDTQGVREMAQLAASFKEMAGALDDRSSYIKQFARAVSHEFKTPLTSILGAAELLDEHIGDMSDKERQRFTGNIIKDADRLKRLVTRLLELARADSFTPGDETSGLDEVLQALRRHWADEGVRIELKEGDARVRLSSGALEMIFSSLIDNAKRHGADVVRIDQTSRGDRMEVIVEDNGEGISNANARKIFEPFFTTRRADGGTGLGLGIVRSLLEKHHGSIHLDEKSGKGACFRLTFPLAAS